MERRWREQRVKERAKRNDPFFCLILVQRGRRVFTATIGNRSPTHDAWIVKVHCSVDCCLGENRVSPCAVHIMH
jgi:hypothetical protein